MASAGKGSPRATARTAERGRPTRGKTARNRLRRTDTFVVLDRPARLRSLPPLYVDLGFGAEPSTTVETYERLRARRPDLRVVGVEIDRERVAAAQRARVPGELEFVVGGFDVDLDHRPAGFIRAMNVLRQYDEHEHRPAIERLLSLLAPGGLLLEGTSSPTGRLLTMNVYEHGVETPRLVLAPNLRRPWAPLELRTVLPKNLIHHAEPGSALDRVFSTWERAWTMAQAQSSSAGTAFESAARALARDGLDVDLRRTMLRRGFLCLRLR